MKLRIQLNLEGQNLSVKVKCRGVLKAIPHHKKRALGLASLRRQALDQLDEAMADAPENVKAAHQIVTSYLECATGAHQKTESLRVV